MGRMMTLSSRIIGKGIWVFCSKSRWIYRTADSAGADRGSSQLRIRFN